MIIIMTDDDNDFNFQSDMILIKLTDDYSTVILNFTVMMMMACFSELMTVFSPVGRQGKEPRGGRRGPPVPA